MPSKLSGSAENPNCFDVELFIVHPSLSADEVSSLLKLEAHVSHSVGQPRVTPEGTSLPGVYPDTRWRHSVRHTQQGQWFANDVEGFVELLKSRRDALAKFRAGGGETTLVLQFMGKGYFGDTIGRKTLAVVVDLGLGFGIECF